MTSPHTVLTRVDVWIARVACVVRAISFRVLVFAFALPLAFLERVDMHLVCHHARLFIFQLTRSDLLQSFGKSNTSATKLFEERHCCA